MQEHGSCGLHSWDAAGIPLTIKFFLPIYSKLDLDTAITILSCVRNKASGLGVVMFSHLIRWGVCLYYVPSMYGTWEV